MAGGTLQAGRGRMTGGSSEAGAGQQHHRAAAVVTRCRVSSGISSGSVAVGLVRGIKSLIHGAAGQPETKGK